MILLVAIVLLDWDQRRVCHLTEHLSVFLHLFNCHFVIFLFLFIFFALGILLNSLQMLK